MTEVKIKFTKQNIEKIEQSELEPGTKELKMEIQTDFLMSQLFSFRGIVGGAQDCHFEKLVFVFKDNAEQESYDVLLNNKNQTFELSFDKTQVFLCVHGFGNIIDKTKPEIQVSPGEKSIVVFFETKFKDIIKLTTEREMRMIQIIRVNQLNKNLTI